MEFFSDLTSSIGAIASGGILGLVGSLASGVFRYFERKQQAVEEDKERDHELALIRLSMEQGDRETENEIKLAETTITGEIRTGSYTMPVAVSNVPSWVNAVRSLFRPFLTLMLNIISTAICFVLLLSLDDPEAAINVALKGESVGAELLRYVIYSIIFASNTATVWWFGDRALTPPGQRNRTG